MFSLSRPYHALAHITRHQELSKKRNHTINHGRLSIVTADSASRGGSDAPPPRLPATNEAVLARIRAAQQYKKDLISSSGNNKSGGSSEDGRTGRRGSNSSGQSPAAAPPPPLSPSQVQQPTPAEQRSFRTNGGNEAEAASWLKTVSSQGLAEQIDKSLSPEQFLLRKEELQRRQDVEIVTIDAAYAAKLRREKARQRGEAAEAPDEREPADEGGAATAAAADADSEGAGEEAYRPKVATWGVFPRPRDISKSLGGGRNLRPGQPLESEEAATERRRSTAAALEQYKRAAGLEVDPAAEAQAAALLTTGRELFKEGLISAALAKFSEASALVPLRSRLGGEAALQHAICLDSLGRNQEAYAIYKQLEGHKTAPGVAKQAKRMVRWQGGRGPGQSDTPEPPYALGAHHSAASWLSPPSVPPAMPPAAFWLQGGPKSENPGLDICAHDCPGAASSQAGMLRQRAHMPHLAHWKSPCAHAQQTYSHTTPTHPSPPDPQWRRYFDRIARQDQLYLSPGGSTDEEEGVQSLAGGVAAGALLLPLVFVLWRVLA